MGEATCDAQTGELDLKREWDSRLAKALERYDYLARKEAGETHFHSTRGLAQMAWKALLKRRDSDVGIRSDAQQKQKQQQQQHLAD